MLILAAQLADVMWPVLVALGIEQVRIDPGNTAFTPVDFVAYAIVDEAMIREAAIKMNRGAKVRRTISQRRAQSDRPAADRQDPTAGRSIPARGVVRADRPQG